MINKQYNPINWSDYDPHNETCMDTNILQPNCRRMNGNYVFSNYS